MVAKGEPQHIIRRQNEPRQVRQIELARGIPFPVIISRQVSETMRVFRSNLTTTLRVYLGNISNQTMASCKKLLVQLNLGLVGELIFHGERLARWLTFWCGFVGLILVGCERVLAPSQDARRRLFVGLAFAITFAYYLALSGFTFWTGSRILYVGEFALLGMFAAVLPSWVWISGPLDETIRWLSLPNDNS